MRKALMSAALLAALALTAPVLAACAKPVPQVAANDQAASSAAPVKWDMASTDPAKNPVVANKEGDAPGYNP